MAARVNINGNTVDSATTSSTDARQSNFIILQGNDVLTNEEKLILEEHEVKIQEYVSENTYLCQYTPSDLEVLRRLPFVKSCIVYVPVLKTTASLKQAIEEETDRTKYEIDVILHSAATQSPEQFASTLAQRIGVSENDMEVCDDKVRLTVDQTKVPVIEKLDNVNRIEEVRPDKLFNDFARLTLHDGDDGPNTGTAPSAKFQGQEQIIAVADTGVDPKHIAFTGRLKKLLPLWKPKMTDSNGHGTHVCGSVLGSGTSSGDSGKSVKVQGTAPQAQLIMQSLWYYDPAMDPPGWRLRTPADLKNLFRVPYADGAFVHSNSWGPGWDDRFGQLGYEQRATQIDTFVNNNQDFVILVAAGNDYSPKRGASQIGANSAAKNCITVGATMSGRPNNGYAFTPQSTQPGDVAALAPFSSRGPTRNTDANGNVIQGRIKPDVMAPGTSILSAGSSNMSSDDRDVNGWSYGQWQDENWIFMSGTSMATPLVAGCVGVIRQALMASKIKPSASLVKAILINGTVDIQGTHNGVVIPPAPNGLQGFGRVDVDNSILMTDSQRPGVGFVDSNDTDPQSKVKSLGPGQSWKGKAASSDGNNRVFTATLVYPDPPGERLQNKLNLIVKATDGTERHGNMGTSQEFDTANNVEKIVWDKVPSGDVSIEVRVAGLTKTDSKQSFAVAWILQ